MACQNKDCAKISSLYYEQLLQKMQQNFIVEMQQNFIVDTQIDTS
jgi:hypothetical protein